MNITIKNLTLSYGKETALNNVSLELDGPKIYGLLGRNGAGKTSLLSIIASFREATSGSITINGEDPFENEHIMQQVAFLYDKNYQDESENIKTILQEIQLYRPNFDMDYANYLCDLFKLDQKKPVKKFSKGKQSALNVTIGLASRAPITIFDEVYLGMDAPSRDLFYKELLKDQEQHPRMIILSTHLVSEMDFLFDEVVILNNGKIFIKDDYETFISQGVTITGKREIVDKIVENKQQIDRQQLGDTVSVTIYDAISDEERALAIDHGVEISSPTLHQLFIHLTKEEV